MDFPENLKYTKEHEWVRFENGTAVMGITKFAGEELGEIVFVELPDLGKEVQAGESVCVVESTKAASDVYSPVTGKVSEVNSSLEATPDLVNNSPYADGWMVKFEGVDEGSLSSLMDAAEYSKLVAQ